MKQGKRICETLKAIRSEIAIANEIDYSPTPCHHEGDCAGTCPKCESETRWLERQLRARQALGKAVTIAGLSMALGAMSSCNSCVSTPPDAGDVPNTDSSFCTKPDTTSTIVISTETGNVVTENDDSLNRITPLRNGNDGADPKGKDDDDDERYQVMGEVAVDPDAHMEPLMK